MKARGEGHPRAILTDAEVLKIRRMYGRGMGYMRIGKTIVPGRTIDPRTIQDIIKRKTWKHLE